MALPAISVEVYASRPDVMWVVDCTQRRSTTADRLATSLECGDEGNGNPCEQPERNPCDTAGHAGSGESEANGGDDEQNQVEGVQNASQYIEWRTTWDQVRFLRRTSAAARHALHPRPPSGLK